MEKIKNTMSPLDQLLAKLNSEEGRAELDNWAKKQHAENLRMKRYADWIKDTPEEQLREFMDKVIKKYDSKEYVDRWYKRGREPGEDLYWVLLDYAERYCKEASQEYYTMFVSECYWLFDDTIIQRLDGQGSVVQILTKEEKDRQIKMCQEF